MHSPIQPDGFERVRRQFTDANGTFVQHNAIFKNVSERLLGRLDLLAIKPARVLDIGCRDGYQLDALRQRYPASQIIGLDPARSGNAAVHRWWRWRRPVSNRISADPHKLPLADGSVDLVVSNLFLPWCHDPALVFVEVARVLSDNGAFLFTSAGPDTLQEYSELWRQIDAAPHVFGLADMHNTGDELLQAGFSAPVLDREVIRVDYPSIDALQDEMQYLGAGNLAAGRRIGLMGADVRKLLRAQVSAQRYAVTLELVHGHGWKGALEKKQGNHTGEYAVSLDSLRQSLRGDAS